MQGVCCSGIYSSEQAESETEGWLYYYGGDMKKAHASKSKIKLTPPPEFAARRLLPDRWSHQGRTYPANLQNAGAPPQVRAHSARG